jgi:hypothetical protein
MRYNLLISIQSKIILTLFFGDGYHIFVRILIINKLSMLIDM